MDWLTFIATVIKALAWPTVVLVVFWILRQQILALVDRLLEVTFPGGSLKFAAVLAQAQAKAEEVRGGGDVARFEGVVHDDPFLELAKQHPEAAIFDGFREIELATLEYTRLFPHAKHVGPMDLVHFLSQKGVLDKSVVDLFEKLQVLRNTALHSQAGVVTPGEAIEYRNLARTVAKAVKEALEALKRRSERRE